MSAEANLPEDQWRRRDGYRGEQRDLYPPPPPPHSDADGFSGLYDSEEQEDEGSFLQGSSQFLDFVQDYDLRQGDHGYGPSYGPSYGEDEEGEYGGEGRYLSYPPPLSEEEEDPDQYPLPSEEGHYHQRRYYDSGGFDEEDTEEREGFGDECYDPYEMELGAGEPSFSTSGGSRSVGGMYSSPAPPSLPPPPPHDRSSLSQYVDLL
jgi:hypothetical protein